MKFLKKIGCWFNDHTWHYNRYKDYSVIALPFDKKPDGFIKEFNQTPIRTCVRCGVCEIKSEIAPSFSHADPKYVRCDKVESKFSPWYGEVDVCDGIAIVDFNVYSDVQLEFSELKVDESKKIQYFDKKSPYRSIDDA